MPQPVIRTEEIGRIVREALILQQNSRPEIEWITDLPERPVYGACDRRLINQALINLLNNAADAIAMRVQRDEDEGKERPRPLGHIRVSLQPDGDMLVIAVEDDGIGLPEGVEVDRLTEPYVTHKSKGTGLGLAIVKKIMEDHRGRIVLADSSSGQGVRAELFLPAREAEVLEGDVMERGHGA